MDDLSPLGKFTSELKALGLEVVNLENNRISMDYVIKDGRLKGKQIKLGFEVPADYELTAPPGPHLSPRIIPINTSVPDHPKRAQESPFGAEWIYLSRPFHQWAHKRTAKRYMEYVDHLLNTL